MIICKAEAGAYWARKKNMHPEINVVHSLTLFLNTLPLFDCYKVKAGYPTYREMPLVLEVMLCPEVTGI